MARTTKDLLEAIHRQGHLGGRQMSEIVAAVHNHNGQADSATDIWDRAAHHDFGHLFYLYKDAERWLDVHGNELSRPEVERLWEVIS
ncbi:hypothetical protein J7643_04215 [bacterium]|nr:hypothetical protein [bacterium]